MDFCTTTSRRPSLPPAAAARIPLDMNAQQRPSIPALLSLAALLTACGAGPLGASDSASSPTDAAAALEAWAPATDAGVWPRTVTLSTRDGAHAGLRLADGVVLDRGELQLGFTRVGMALETPGGGSLCGKGNFPSLEAVPTADAPCTSGSGWGVWMNLFSYNGGASDLVGGLALLVRDASHTTYRVRVLGDVSTIDEMAVTLEYAPVP